MLDKIIPKLLREYMDTDDPARRAELVQVLQDYGAFPRIFEVCDRALSGQTDQRDPADISALPAAKTSAPIVKKQATPIGTSDYFVANID